jgi:hypothetical protein
MFVIGSRALTCLQDRKTLEAVIEEELKAHKSPTPRSEASLPMVKRRGQGTRRTRAIQNTLARVGMQASPEQVVAALADLGILVNEALVLQVKMRMLKRLAQVGRQQVKALKGWRLHAPGALSHGSQ